MVKNKKNKKIKSSAISNKMQEDNSDDTNNKMVNIEISPDPEEEEEISEQNQDKNENEENEENEEDENIEIKEFTIELIIHTRVMDNREEIKRCICRNHIILDEKENKDSEENENIYIEKEIIPSIKIPITKLKNNQNLLNQNNDKESSDNFYIKMNDLSKSLLKLGFPASGSMFNIFIDSADNYIYFGTEPFDNKTILYSFMLEPNTDLIRIQLINYLQKKMLDGYTNSIINTYFRKPIQKKTQSLDLKPKIFSPSMTNLEYYNEGSDNEEFSQSLSSKNSYKEEEENLPKNTNNDKKKKIFGSMTDSHKRERKIGYIIEKVYSWRKLYNGYKNEKNKFVKYSLDRAAEKVGVSKKSLDDYLLQLRLGRKYGFDFDANKYNKIGVLRDFVKQKKDQEIAQGQKIVKKRNIKKRKKIKNKNEDKKEDNKKEDNNIKKENEIIKTKENKFLEDLDLKKNTSKRSIKNINFIGKKRKNKNN